MIKARRLEMTGRVQGCGMRPALVRLASACRLVGWVANAGASVRVHVQGEEADLAAFCDSIPANLPPGATVRGMFTREKPLCEGLVSFRILEGRRSASADVPDLPPDTGICAACVAELADPANRRYGYPFTACTRCGPRLALLQAWPFSRQNTSFAPLPACPACEDEALDPDSRRFGEELVCCPVCGPSLSWRVSWQPVDAPLPMSEILRLAIDSLRSGKLIAVKGMAGFHLLCRADSSDAVDRVRRLKARPAKPLALLLADLPAAQAIAEVDAVAADWLQSPSRPVVLLPRRWRDEGDRLAPGLDRLGVMLPATGLQRLLADGVGVPLVATSANRRGEPVAARAADLQDWLEEGLDGILDHTLEIRLPQDDSVLALSDGHPVWMRRSRGRLDTLSMTHAVDGWVRGEGAWNKNVIAWAHGGRVIAGPPTGDRGLVLAEQRREQVASCLESLLELESGSQRLYEWHPDADSPANSVRHFFHHRSHLAALLLDAGDTGEPALVACWDGLGAGEDGSWWGSTGFLRQDAGWSAVVHLLPFPLPGGDACQREPWRVAATCLTMAGVSDHDIHDWLSGLADGLAARWALLHPAMSAQPECSSLGRFFEAMACIILGRPDNQHEGDIAARLEARARAAGDAGIALPVPFTEKQAIADTEGRIGHWDWRPLVRALWDNRVSRPDGCARGLHAALAGMLVAEAKRYKVKRIGMTGGCFQNVLLLQEVRRQADAVGVDCFSHISLSPNDESLGWGQIALAAGYGGDAVPSGGR